MHEIRRKIVNKWQQQVVRRDAFAMAYTVFACKLRMRPHNGCACASNATLCLAAAAGSYTICIQVAWRL